MKKTITLLLVLFAIITSCKKDSKQSNKLAIQVSEVTTATYSFAVSNKKGEHIYGVDLKTQNDTYETTVTPGDEINILLTTSGRCRLTFTYNGNPAGGAFLNTQGSTKTTVHIPN